MRALLIIFTGFFFSLTAFSQKSTVQYAGTYEFHFPGSKLAHYIILKKDGDKLSGKYLGAEAGNDTIYYSAVMKNLEISNDGKIEFKLKAFRLSPTPLQPGNEELTPEGQTSIQEKIRGENAGTPMFIRGGYKFTGAIGRRSIQLQRVADQYNSGTDDMKFTRLAK